MTLHFIFYARFIILIEFTPVHLYYDSNNMVAKIENYHTVETTYRAIENEYFIGIIDLENSNVK